MSLRGWFRAISVSTRGPGTGRERTLHVVGLSLSLELHRDLAVMTVERPGGGECGGCLGRLALHP